MFFSLSRQEDNNFPNCYRLGSFCLNTDQGWIHIVDRGLAVVYKGYCDDVNMIDNIGHLLTKGSLLSERGNFTVFLYKDSNILIKQSQLPSYQIRYNSVRISNLYQLDNVLAADKAIEIVNKNFEFEIKNLAMIDNIDLDILDEESVIDRIYDHLNKKVQTFIEHNTLPIKVFLTGGIDSLLVFSFVKKHTDQFEVVTAQHFDIDYFWAKNSTVIQQQWWSYRQIHHWRENSILLSGTPGDEFTLRSPATVNLYLKHHKIDINQLLENNKNCLHYQYYLLEKHQQLFAKQNSDPLTNKIILDRKHLYKYLCNMNINDFQHWHIGNTLTYTPLRDLTIFKYFLQLPLESAIKQALDSHTSKQLIKRNDPSLLSYISTNKNLNPFDNVWKFFEQQ